MATKTRRKANTAMVFNPSRGLSIGGRSTVRRAARKNPVKTAAVANPRHKKRHHRRRRNPASTLRVMNPSGLGGLVVAAVMAGVGVSLFDIVTSRVLPQTSSLVRTGVKFGGAFLFQSSIGGKIPIIGKYKNDIALVLAVAGMVDLMKLYVLPIVSQAVGNITGNALQLVAPPAATPLTDTTLGGVYSPRPASWNQARRYAY